MNIFFFGGGEGGFGVKRCTDFGEFGGCFFVYIVSLGPWSER